MYNFREIREELTGRGHTFRGGSDTEVMLAAFREWGVDAAVRRFIGMFAFALWDSGARKLYLVRDRLGIKPLFLARLPGMLLFASELKALLAYPDFPREVDRSALQYFLEFQYVPGPHAIYRNVEKVLPGHIVEIGQRRGDHGPPLLGPVRSLGKSGGPPEDRRESTRRNSPPCSTPPSGTG